MPLVELLARLDLSGHAHLGGGQKKKKASNLVLVFGVFKFTSSE